MKNIKDWNVSSVTDTESMFNGVTLSTINYDALLLDWSGQALQNKVLFSGGNSQYSPYSQATRDVIVNTYGWSITDGGAAP